MTHRDHMTRRRHEEGLGTLYSRVSRFSPPRCTCSRAEGGDSRLSTHMFPELQLEVHVGSSVRRARAAGVWVCWVFSFYFLCARTDLDARSPRPRPSGPHRLPSPALCCGLFSILYVRFVWSESRLEWTRRGPPRAKAVASPRPPRQDDRVESIYYGGVPAHARSFL